MSIPKTLEKQVGGSHYKKYAIQPLEFAEKIGLKPILFSAFKYVVRYKDKNGLQDLDKAIHCLEIFNEIGKEKELFIGLDDLADFLKQFSKPQAKALFIILQAQGNKNKLLNAKYAIEHLKMFMKKGVSND